MKESRDEVMGNDVKSMLNAISGTYTILLIDKLFPMRKKTSDMEDIYSALAALAEMGRVMEAMQMIRGLFRIAGEEYPFLIASLEEQENMQEFFVMEFLEDFFEIIEEYRLGAKCEI